MQQWKRHQTFTETHAPPALVFSVSTGHENAQPNPRPPRGDPCGPAWAQEAGPLPGLGATRLPATHLPWEGPRHSLAPAGKRAASKGKKSILGMKTAWTCLIFLTSYLPHHFLHSLAKTLGDYLIDPGASYIPTEGGVFKERARRHQELSLLMRVRWSWLPCAIGSHQSSGHLTQFTRPY